VNETSTVRGLGSQGEQPRLMMRCSTLQSNRQRGLNSAFFAAHLRPSAAAVLRVMPTYEYSCEKCGKSFEAFQSMRDDPFRECPRELCRQKKWGHGKVKRLVGTGAGLIFKGSGFYITDYRSNSYKEAAKKDAPAAAASSSGEKASGAKESASSSAPAAPSKDAASKPAKKEKST
jgi:putative FmdB family regulatory protein